MTESKKAVHEEHKVKAALLDKLSNFTKWSNLDLFIYNKPPGTGDTYPKLFLRN
jgi:hypothetical protein